MYSGYKHIGLALVLINIHVSECCRSKNDILASRLISRDYHTIRFLAKICRRSKFPLGRFSRYNITYQQYLWVGFPLSQDLWDFTLLQVQALVESRLSRRIRGITSFVNLLRFGFFLMWIRPHWLKWRDYKNPMPIQLLLCVFGLRSRKQPHIQLLPWSASITCRDFSKLPKK